jgi:hypothetical protein
MSGYVACGLRFLRDLLYNVIIKSQKNYEDDNQCYQGGSGGDRRPYQTIAGVVGCGGKSHKIKEQGAGD